jgi:hypothetical protein
MPGAAKKSGAEIVSAKQRCGEKIFLCCGVSSCLQKRNETLIFANVGGASPEIELVCCSHAASIEA